MINHKGILNPNYKQGLSKTRIYRIWGGIIQRCNNPKHPAYKNYGGRGIKIYIRWLQFQNFFEDMSRTYQDNLMIDRINNEGNYEPGNCRWTNRLINNNNKRTSLYAKGYRYSKIAKKFQAQIGFNGHKIHLGYFGKEEDAHNAYLSARERFLNKFREIK